MIIRLASTVVLAGVVGGLLAATPIGGTGTAGTVSVSAARSVATTPATAAPAPTEVAKGDVNPGQALEPRVPFNKVPSESIQLPVDSVSGRPMWTGRLGVKFRDELRIRADRTPSDFARGADGRPVKAVSDTLRTFGGSIRQMINRTPQDLAALEARAAGKSGQAQADLASMVWVDVLPERLLDAARAFNSLDIVEWVNIERIVLPDGTDSQAEQKGCGANGPNDGIGITNCYTASPDSRCSTLGGGPGCNDPGACSNDPQGPQCRYGCNNINCCETVADLLPNCSDEGQAQGWDALCATYANILCQGTVYDTNPPTQGDGPSSSTPSTPSSYKFDPCFAMRGPFDFAMSSDILIQGAVVTPAGVQTVPSQLLTYTTDNTGAYVDGSAAFIAYPNNLVTDEANPTTDVPQQALPDPSLEGAYLSLSAGCFSDHSFGGCNQVSCCVYVCRTDPSCCVVQWDANCIDLAQNAPAGVLFPSPCTGQELPSGSFPPAGATPLLTAGRVDLGGGSFGNARGYQNYTLATPILGPFDPLPVGQTYPVQPPTVNASNPLTPDPLRLDPNSSLGTLAVINSGFRGAGLDLQGYDQIVTQLGINPTTKAHGNGITVAVIEHAAYVNHEDLVNRTTGESGQTQVLVISDPIDPNHGTAVLGVIGAEDNTIGVTGIAEGALMRFYPIVSREEGSRLYNALTNAIIDLNEGDVVNMSIGLGGGNTIVSDPTVFTLVQVGTAAGITFVASAGNSASPVVTAPAGVEGADSGAIIVGACWPGFQVGQLTDTVSRPGPVIGFNYCRLNFSNFTDPEAQAPAGQVHMSAWGTGVTSTGYGDLFNGTNVSSDPLQVNKLRSYTAAFNGTSSAAPIISGFCARMQSFSNAYFGVPLPPTALRGVLANNVNRQCGIDYASPQFPGYPEGGTPWAGDIVPIGQGGQLAKIGGFPRAKTCVSGAVANTYGATPTQWEIITGTYMEGSRFSIRQRDLNFLRINSVRKNAGRIGQGYGPGIIYPLTGYTTDVQVTLDTVQQPSAISFITMNVNSLVSVNTPVAEIVYFYNRKQNRWRAAGTSYLSSTPSDFQTSPVGDARDYVVQTSTGSRIYARVYTCSLTQNSSHIVLHDLIELLVNVDIFDPSGGGNQAP